MTTAARPRLSLAALAWPIFVESGSRVLIGTVDTFMVSRVSDGAVAALGVANQVVNLGLMLFTFIGAGSTVVMTHHLGAGDRRGADRIAALAMSINGWLGLLVSAAVVALAALVLRLMQLPSALMGYALPFLRIMGGTLVIESVNVVMSATLRARGRTRETMAVMLGQNALNAVGNCLLLFGLAGLPRLGVVGVAISSVVSRVVAFAALRAMVHRRTGVRVGVRDAFSFPTAQVRRVLELGVPIAGENVCWALAFMAVTSFVARMGASSLAAQSYTMQLTTWATLLGSAVAFGNQILVGHLVGDGDLDEAYRQVWASLRAGLSLVIGMLAVLGMLAPRLLSFFTSDPATASTAVLLVRMAVLLETGRVSNLIVINALRAAGDARFPVLMAMASMWLVQVPLAWLLGLHLGLGVPGVWIALATDEWFRAGIMQRRWRRRTWHRHAERSRAMAAAAHARES
ncbi:MAG TPA: MATE family efflux transporter [Anaeromyxobacter sp.]|nr:MATE family efflux transporter [Anaeromyxobacter sp.]